MRNCGCIGGVNGGTVKCNIGVGSIIFNDYLLELSEIEGGHRLTVTRGSEIQSIDILDGQGGTEGATIAIDETLTQSGQAADALVTGEKLRELSEALQAVVDALDGAASFGSKIAINGEVIEPVDGVVHVPIGSAEVFGVVKSTDVDGGVTILEDGTMMVNSMADEDLDELKAYTDEKISALGTMANEAAENYVLKADAAGYDDILTKTDAAAAYDTKGSSSQALTDANTYTDEQIAAINAVVEDKADSADLSDVAISGNVNSLVQDEGDVLILNGGTSTENI